MEISEDLEEQSREILKKTFQLIGKGNRSRECLDVLKQLYQILLLQSSPLEPLPNQLLQVIVNLLLENQTPIKMRLMVLLVLHELVISGTDLELFKTK